MIPQRIADPFYRVVVGQYQTAQAVVQPNRPKTNYIVVHHAAADYNPGRACQAIFQYHSQKWPLYGRIGYHEIIQIEADGSLRAYQVNPQELQGAGVLNRNDECYHICAATNFGTTVPLQLWQDAIALRVAEAVKHYPQAQIVGHREIATAASPTACPGDKWMAWKPILLQRVRVLNGPAVTRYKVEGVPIYQRQDRTGALAGYLWPGDEVEVDATYPDGGAHLRDGRGFVDLKALRSA